MSTYKGTIKKWVSTGSVWDILYPQTTMDQVISLNTALASMQSDIDNRVENPVTTVVAVSQYSRNLTKNQTVIYNSSSNLYLYLDADNEGGSFEVGDSITIIKYGSGFVYIAQSGGTLYRNIGGAAGSGSCYIGGRYVAVTLIKIATNTWVAIGLLSTTAVY